MESTPDILHRFEEEIEDALHHLEMNSQLDQALVAYQAVEKGLNELQIPAEHPDYAEYQRVLAYCWMREGNILRQLKRPQDAMAMGELEIGAARASGNPITLARSLMSFGINQIVTGQVEAGQQSLAESRALFQQGEGYDYRQGLGWILIIQADLINAGLVSGNPSEVIEITSQALSILESIENWPGVARSYEARAKAQERMGNHEAAEADRIMQKQAESKIQDED